MARRTGWLALAALAALFFLATAAGVVWQLFDAVRGGKPVIVVVAAALGAAVLCFWAWIALGARARSRPRVDPETGEPLPVQAIGAWGWVGRGLTFAVLGGFVTVGVWAGVAGRRDDTATERVRQRADRTANDAGLTVAKVRAARQSYDAWLLQEHGGNPGPSPLDRLLPVSGAEVVDAAVDPGHAAMLIRPDQGPPCVVVDVDATDQVTTRISRRC